jgi:hypothetical protein
MIWVLGLLGGALLGTRYRVLCLIPTVMTGIAAISAFDVIEGVPVGSTVLRVIVLSVALQIGYLIGVAIRFAFLTAPVRGLAGSKPLRQQPARPF